MRIRAAVRVVHLLFRVIDLQSDVVDAVRVGQPGAQHLGDLVAVEGRLHQDVRELKLTDPQKKDLVEFLKALSGEGWQHVKPPTRFPE